MHKSKKITDRPRPIGIGICKKLFLIINVLLLTLILLLGVAVLQCVRTPGFEPKNAYAGLAEPAKTETVKPDVRIPKLDDFSINSNEANAVSRDGSANVKTASAKREMNLELVGTVVSNDPDLDRAFFFNRSTGAQKAYRQGNKVDGGLIKKILHAKVIISPENSDELLIFRVGGSPTLSRASSYAHQISDNSVSLHLTHKEVEASLADIDMLEKRFEISPFINGGQPMGFRVENIIPDSLFDKMGLRYGEAITAVNGQPIAEPGEFFQQLKAEGNITISVQKRPGVRRRSRSIHLYIS